MKLKQIFVLFFTVLILFSYSEFGKTAVDKLSMEEFYKVRSYFGKSARVLQFSENDRYLAFLWNPYNEFGYDLYIYDFTTKKIKRVTSIELMKKFDTPEDYEKFIEKGKQKREEEAKTLKTYYMQRDYLMGKDVDLSSIEKEEINKLKIELKKLKEEKEKEDKKKATKKKSKKDKKSLSKDKDKKLELWELRDKLKEKKEKDKIKRTDLYPGVSNYQWTKDKTKTDLIFEYRGDLFRYFADTGKLIRLTMTDKRESLISYTLNSKGYYYSKGNKLYLVNFNSSFIHQLNHKFNDAKDKEKQIKLNDTIISPNGKWMIIIGSIKTDKSADKSISVINYEKRFAKIEKTKRQMADTKRNEPSYKFFLRKVEDINYGKQPKSVFDIPGGDIWYEYSEILWSKDSRYYAFMTWEREKGDLKIWLGDLKNNKKPKLFYKMKESIGYKGTYMNNLRFTPDSKNLIAILNNKFGFRQPFMFNLKSKKKTELIKGKFESFPVVGFSQDSKLMYIVSDKENPAYLAVYKVNLENKKMTLVGMKKGTQSTNAISHNHKFLATVFGNWNKPSELFVIKNDNLESTVLTDSHNHEWSKINFISPELFTYKNRRKMAIHGMIFKPKDWKPTDKRASIVYMYGGPLGRAHTVSTGRTSSLSYMFQMIMAAKHGFVTINIDTQGQSGYGRSFNESNFKNPGKRQAEDLEDLVKEMKKGKFGIDTTRVGLHGWSFGGYQTLYTMFTSPTTFSCAIAAAPPTEWENYNSWYTGATIGESKRGKLNLRKYSLIPLAKGLKRPLLLVHGMMDKNVLYQNTVNVYRALLLSGKETLVDLFLDPEGVHGLRGVIQNKATFKKFESWFVKHLKK